MPNDHGERLRGRQWLWHRRLLAIAPLTMKVTMAMRTACIIDKLLVATATLALIGAGWYVAHPQEAANKSLGMATQGTDTVAIFVVSSTCRACTDKRLVRNVVEAKRALDATRRGKRLRFLGVAADPDPHRGLKFLKRFEPFEEVSSGGGWANAVVLRHVWGDSMAIGSVPQLIIVERAFSTSTDRVAPASEDVLVRLHGYPQIIEWLREQNHAYQVN